MVVGYTDVNDGCTDGSADRITDPEDKEDALKIELKDYGTITGPEEKTRNVQNDVPQKILDICSRTTADKDRIVETTVDVVSSSDESTDECDSSSEDDNNALDTVGNNQNNQMVNKMTDCKDFLVANRVQIINNYQQQHLDVEQLKYITDGNTSPKSLWTDGIHSDESIERAHKQVSYPFGKAVSIAVTVILVLVVIVVGIEIWQLKSPEAEGNPDSQCGDLPLIFSKRYVDRQAWFARIPKTPLQKFPSLPLSTVIIDTTGGFACSSHFYCPNAVLELQNRAIAGGQQDIPSNFVLVEDGYIYEARGWDFVGENVPGQDKGSLEILIMGNFDTTFPACSNVSLPLLLSEGVRLGRLSPRYVIYGKNQFTNTSTMNPDSPLVKDMKNWSRWVAANALFDRWAYLLDIP